MRRDKRNAETGQDGKIQQQISDGGSNDKDALELANLICYIIWLQNVHKELSNDGNGTIGKSFSKIVEEGSSSNYHPRATAQFVPKKSPTLAMAMHKKASGKRIRHFANANHAIRGGV
jgi:hypothetical protein